MKKITIAIDGHSSCGKSTLARDLAERLNFVYIDSGAMYRVTTLYFQENSLNIDGNIDVDAIMSQIEIVFSSHQGTSQVILNGRDVSQEIRTQKVSSYVSEIATNSIVRKHLVKQQQSYGNDSNIVMDGRDIGTVVFPNAELKLFLTADIDVRTNRRWKELQDRGTEISKSEVKNNLSHRDSIDSSREDSPLSIAQGAVVLDNSYLSRLEQFEMVKALALFRMKNT